MKNRLIIAAVMLALVPVVGGCADPDSPVDGTVHVSEYLHHTYMPSRGHVYVLNNHDVLVARIGNGEIKKQASLFTNGRMRSNAIVENLLWLMRVTGVSEAYIGEVQKTLSSSAKLKGRAFAIELTQSESVTHRFSMARTGRNQLYVLTYERI